MTTPGKKVTEIEKLLKTYLLLLHEAKAIPNKWAELNSKYKELLKDYKLNSNAYNLDDSIKINDAYEQMTDLQNRKAEVGKQLTQMEERIIKFLSVLNGGTLIAPIKFSPKEGLPSKTYCFYVAYNKLKFD